MGDKAAPDTKKQVGKSSQGAGSRGAILQPGCPSESPGQHFKYPGARRRNWNQCPREHSLRLRISCEGMIFHSYPHVLSVCLSLSFCLCLTHTHTRAHRAGSFTQRAAESTASVGSSSGLQLHPGWSPAARRNPAGAEGGGPCLHAHLIPIPDSLTSTPKGDQDPVPSTHPPLLRWKQKGFTKTKNPPACRYSTQRFARGIHSV